MGATTADMKGAIDDVNKLKESIADIITSDRETKNWIASADTRVQKLQKDIETTSEIRSRVSELDRGFDKLVASVLKASSDLQSNLDRIEKVEDEMKEKISELGDRFRTNYQDEARDLRFRLETIESKHSEEARQMMAIQNEIVGLKQTSKAYSARNTELNAGHKSGSVPRDYPLLSTEASTEFLRSSNSGYLQVLASPPSGQMNTM
jgi:chromosome segregation ATPase